MTEKWDLQAVVGGCINDEYAMENPHLSFEPWTPNFHQQNPITFPGYSETNPKVADELEQLYKPFYPNSNPFSTQTIITTSLPLPPDIVHHEPPGKPKKQQSFTTVNKDTVAKPRRFSRKNQQNRVVQHVTADELPSDAWAWRKYGQKPIKGSPFPRSYYRCSSSKGCLARKQVERSNSDPGVFIITYTAEHCHAHPTRRSSLAGSTRNKSSTAVKKDEPHAETTAAFEDESSLKLKMEELEMVELEGEEERGKILRPVSDELVERFEDFDGLFVDEFPDLSHEIWCP